MSKTLKAAIPGSNNQVTNGSLLVHGDALSSLRNFPEETFQTCVTSPPYWALRDYGVEGQIGLELSLDTYLSKLIEVFTEVYRTIRKDGTLWLNIGDSYTSGGRTWRAPDPKNGARAMKTRPPTPAGLKRKDLIGVPWRLAFALQESGWYLRSDVIWNKPNGQPESVKDRPTKSHEYLFLLSKSEHYFYDNGIVRGPNDRNLRTVWNIPTQSSSGLHEAIFPEQLVERCLKLTSRVNDLVLDPFMGSGTCGVVAERLDRRFVGIEINEKYVAMAGSQLKNMEVVSYPANQK